MASTSSRGPDVSRSSIKPEIGAPGASVSAIAGTGTSVGPFGGTSGAAPMVAGAAALLLEATGGTKATAKGTPNGGNNNEILVDDYDRLSGATARNGGFTGVKIVKV